MPWENELPLSEVLAEDLTYATAGTLTYADLKKRFQRNDWVEEAPLEAE